MYVSIIFLPFFFPAVCMPVFVEKLAMLSVAHVRVGLELYTRGVYSSLRSLLFK